MKSQVLEQLNHIHDEFDVDTSDIISFIEEQDSEIETLEEKLDELKDEVSSLEDKVDDKKREISDLEEQLEDKEGCFEYPDGFQSSIVMDLALEKLFDNLEKISPTDLEDFVNKYAV